MNLDRLLDQLGEWLRGTGPDNDVVVSTRIRLARNLAGLPFTNRASPHQKAEVESRLREAIESLDLVHPLRYVSMTEISSVDRQFLVERQLVSRELATILEGPRGVAFDERESVSIMVNEEDQIRMQSMRSGFDLDTAWHTIDQIDDMVEAKVEYAFSDDFGYLTACPTNVGTGMRASVMLHLPALGMTKQIEKAFKALQKINLVVRGLYGEGSRALGDLYQISNQITLGKSEAAALTDIRSVIGEVMSTEQCGSRFLKAYPDSKHVPAVRRMMLTSLFYEGEYETCITVAVDSRVANDAICCRSERGWNPWCFQPAAGE